MHICTWAVVRITLQRLSRGPELEPEPAQESRHQISEDRSAYTPYSTIRRPSSGIETHLVKDLLGTRFSS